MYIELNGKLINKNFISKVYKLDKEEDSTVVYCLVYELTSGTTIIREFEDETSRDDEFFSFAI